VHEVRLEDRIAALGGRDFRGFSAPGRPGLWSAPPVAHASRPLHVLQSDCPTPGPRCELTGKAHRMRICIAGTALAFGSMAADASSAHSAS
jgi:hypothetical protein